MTLATKTLATIMLVAFLTLSATNAAAASFGGSDGNGKRGSKQLERLYKHHDRKMELRASVLEVTPDELKGKLKSQSFEQVIKKSGFKDITSFHTAMIGKMKEELHKRGWNESRIQDFMSKKMDRYMKNSSH